jgi:cystathionine beta-lyase family protein involved in aluminum resistance
MNYYGYDFSQKTLELAEQAELDCREQFSKIDEICMKCSAKVLQAFQSNNVSSTDFIEVNGYGYYDGGRSKLEKIYSEIFGAEDALVRVQIMSGTHALALAFGGLLKHGDTLLSVSGEPYDTLRSIIGTSGDSRNSLMANGIKYEEIDLIDSEFDLDAIAARIAIGNVKIAAIQRSRGYSHRKSLTIEKIAQAIKVIHKTNPNVIVLVDNCYGDFTEELEPTHVGADIIVGSMMKNLGAGIAVSGGYCVGRKDLINDIAERLTAPCVGKDLGANFNQLTSFYKGLFMAPSAVRSALKTMVFAARMLQLAGFCNVDPSYDEMRTDIVQTVDLLSEENLVAFCRGIQSGSPVEAYVEPMPDDMPGYPHKEVMAGGTFTAGSTIELSCDGPITPPYTAYMQGGLTYEYGKLGILHAIDYVINK